MPTLQDTLDATDAWLITETILDDLATYQAGLGFPWQGLKSHTVEPLYTNDGLLEDGTRDANLLANSPTDQADSWDDAAWLGVLPEWVSSLCVDVYDGPHGAPSYQVTVNVLWEGDRYARTIAYGAEEPDRTSPWNNFGALFLTTDDGDILTTDSGDILTT